MEFWWSINRVASRGSARRLVCALTITLCFSSLCSPASAQIQPGSMVNIDCGISTPYLDTKNLTWVPDEPYVSTGVNVQNVSEQRDLTNLRFFPEPRKKACYVLPAVSGGRYFIRGRFYHGGYDGNKQPRFSFNVSIEATDVQVINVVNVTAIYAFTHIVQATKNSIYICLIRNSPTGHPFMSSLQSVTLASGMYPQAEEPAGLRYLSFVKRLNFGSPGTGTYSYPQDPYDRNWRNDALANTPSAVKTEHFVTNGTAFNRPPLVVMQSAKLGGNDTFIRVEPVTTHYVLYLYFAEIDNTTTLGSRVFDILINNEAWVTNFDILANKSGVRYESMQLTKLIESPVHSFSFTLLKSADSLQEPLINAAEALQLSEIVALRALDQDVLGVESIKTAFGLNTWTGDPCMPVPYDWILCDSSSPARVIEVQLANMSLVGSIPAGIANFTALRILNLQNNNLTGSVPESILAIPGLTIQIGGNPLLTCPRNQCTVTTKPGASNGTSTIAVVIGAAVGGAVVLAALIILLVVCVRRRKKNARPHDGIPVPQKLNRTQPLEQQGVLKASFLEDPPDEGRSAGFKAAKKTFTTISESKVPVLPPLEVVTGSIFSKSNNASKTSEASNSSSRSRHSGTSVGRRSTTSSEGRLELSIHRDVRKYSWGDVLGMTHDNKVELGKGGFGPVYLGKLPDGREVAVKILSATSHQGTREFLNEVDLLSRVNHGNLVKLMGYCQEPEQVLIYEFAEEGTLREHLYELSGANSMLGDGRREKLQARSFNWKIRLDIAVNSACGLEYLHTGCRPSIIHRDIKSSNILLTRKMLAKVADFGLSKLGADEGDLNQTHVSTMVKGTVGYIDPEYYTSNQLTYKSDVFSFGVVLLEIVTGRKPIQPCEDPNQRYIGNWVRERYKADDIRGITDPALNAEYNVRAMRLVISLALKCISTQGADRPDMSEVVQELRTAVKLEKRKLMNTSDFLSESEDTSMSRPLPSSHSISSFSSSQVSPGSGSAKRLELL